MNCSFASVSRTGRSFSTSGKSEKKVRCESHCSCDGRTEELCMQTMDLKKAQIYTNLGILKIFTKTNTIIR